MCAQSKWQFPTARNARTQQCKQQSDGDICDLFGFAQSFYVHVRTVLETGKAKPSFWGLAWMWNHVRVHSYRYLGKHSHGCHVTKSCTIHSSIHGSWIPSIFTANTSILLLLTMQRWPYECHAMHSTQSIHRGFCLLPRHRKSLEISKIHNNK